MSLDISSGREDLANAPIDHLICCQWQMDADRGGRYLPERYYLSDTELSVLHADMSARIAGDCLIVSSCFRFMILCYSPDTDNMADILQQWGQDYFQDAFIDQSALPDYSCVTGKAALQHFFSVAASLDSPYIGETHILGQVKKSYQLANRQQALQGFLENVCQAAFHCAKKVYHQTDIGMHAISMTNRALQVAQDLFGDLQDKKLLLVGFGAEAVSLALHFRSQSGVSVSLTHPSERRGRWMADQCQADYQMMQDDRVGMLKQFDFIVTGLGDRDPVFQPWDAQQAIRHRRGQPMLFFDMNCPADLPTEIHDVDLAYLYDLGDLERLGQQALSQREANRVAAEQIVTEHVQRFCQSWGNRNGDSAITALRRHSETLRQQVLSDLDLLDDPAAQQATRLFMKRLLHHPSKQIKNWAETGGLDDQEQVLRNLFPLTEKSNE